MAVQLFHVGVKALITNSDGEVLLLQVNPEKLRGYQPAYWDIPGGRIEENATVAETLAREVHEELGVSVQGDPAFITSVVSNIKIPINDLEVGLVLMVYSVALAGNTIVLSDEHIACEWVSRAEAADRLSHKYPAEFTDSLN